MANLDINKNINKIIKTKRISKVPIVIIIIIVSLALFALFYAANARSKTKDATFSDSEEVLKNRNMSTVAFIQDLEKSSFRGDQAILSSDYARGYYNEKNLQYALQNLAPEILEKVPVDVLKNIPPEVLNKIPPELLEKLSPEVLSSIDPEVLKNMPPEMLANLTKDGIKNLPPEILKDLPPELLATLPPEVLAKLPPEVLAKLPAEVLAKLPAEVINKLPPEVLKELPPEALKSLSLETLKKLPPEVLEKLSPEALNGLTADEIAKLPLEVLKKLPPEVLAKLPVEVLKKLPKDILDELAYNSDELRGRIEEQLVDMKNRAKELDAKNNMRMQAFLAPTKLSLSDSDSKKDKDEDGLGSILNVSKELFSAAANAYQQPALPQVQIPKDTKDDEDKNKSFLKNAADNGYLGNTITKPISKYEIKAGWIIPATLITSINSDIQGQILAQVSQNVYDTSTGRYLLIPQGTKIVGAYSSSILWGQSRLLVAWNKLIYPNGSTLILDNMQGTSPDGVTGFTDLVDNHYFRTFSSAFLLSAITAGIALTDSSDGQTETAKDKAVSQAIENMSEVVSEVIKKNLNIAPTLEIRSGYKFNIFVTKDIILEPFNKERY